MYLRKCWVLPHTVLQSLKRYAVVSIYDEKTVTQDLMYKMETDDFAGQKDSVYLDYNATTPLSPPVLSAIHEALDVGWGNPSSSHEAGRKAKVIINKSREDVARMIGAKTSDIVFTSGGTEANNMILQTAVDYFKKTCSNITTDSVSGKCQRPHIISSHMEHPAVTAYLQHLTENADLDVTYVPLSHVTDLDVTYVPLSHVTGRLEVESVVQAIQANTIMVTVMLANNETGIIQPVAEICRAVKTLQRGAQETPRILVHTDAAQAIGKIPVCVQELGVDYLTVVGHKYYGPRIGAVYARDLEKELVPLYPMLYGGGQEQGFRPGTENTGMIAGLGKASELVADNLSLYQNDMQNCRDYLETKLQEVLPCKLKFNGRLSGNKRLPNTCNVSLIGQGLEGHKVLSRCKRLQASVGAACHAQNRPSPILLAIGVPESIARNAVRLSVGRGTTLEDIDTVVEDLRCAVTDIIQEESCQGNQQTS